MKFKHLLAKTTDNGQEPGFSQTLLGHTSQVMKAAKVLSDFLADDVAAMLKGDVPQSCWKVALLTAAWLHDIGKANDHFQQMIRNPRFRQGIRHETLALVVLTESMDEELEPLWNLYPE